jgi:hypothetical protein
LSSFEQPPAENSESYVMASSENFWKGKGIEAGMPNVDSGSGGDKDCLLQECVKYFMMKKREDVYGYLSYSRAMERRLNIELGCFYTKERTVDCQPQI